MKRLVPSLLALLTVGPVVCAAPVLAAPAAPPPVSFTADPAAGSSTSPTGGWFVLRAAAGSSTRQALTLRNTSSWATELVLDPVDATTSAVGGASYGLPTEAVTRTGGWVQPGRDRVVLAPGEEVEVPFTVDVPASAEPGDHLAGLSVAAPSDVSTAAATQGKGPATSLDLRTRRVIAVQVEVPGAAEPRIDVGAVTAAVRPTGVQLELALTNSGRRITRGTGVLTLAATGERTEFVLDTFVPGTSIAYPLPWPADLASGRHEAQVQLSYDGRSTQWSGVLEVDDEQTAAAARDEASAKAVPATAGPAGGGPPVALLAAAVAGGVAVAVAGQVAVGRLRRRARQHD